MSLLDAISFYRHHRQS